MTSYEMNHGFWLDMGQFFVGTHCHVFLTSVSIPAFLETILEMVGWLNQPFSVCVLGVDIG